jgi:hypothetical protein
MTDRNFERALRTAARHGRTAGVCPDAGMLAAYADRSLSTAEHAALEAHIADCVTCTEQLALIAALDVPEETAIPTPAFDIGHLVRRWGWLVPVATAVLVVAVWMRTPARKPFDAASEGRQAAQAAADSKQRDASTVLPASPAIEQAARAPARDSESDRAIRQRAAANDAPAATPLPKAEAFATKAAPAPAPTISLQGAIVRKEDEIASDARDSLSDGARPASPAPPRPAEERQDLAPAGAGEAGSARSSGLALMRKTARASSMSEETGTVLVRATLGRIDRSTDAGRTWTTELTGLTDRIQVTRCPSADACWLGAESGAVFVRTADGTWLRRLLPAPASPVRQIVALDREHATVGLSDGRRYVTTNSGLTWTDAPRDP